MQRKEEKTNNPYGVSNKIINPSKTLNKSEREREKKKKVPSAEAMLLYNEQSSCFSESETHPTQNDTSARI